MVEGSDVPCHLSTFQKLKKEIYTCRNYVIRRPTKLSLFCLHITAGGFSRYCGVRWELCVIQSLLQSQPSL